MINFPKLEEEILQFWKREKIFEKSLEKKSPKGTFVFYEGPPTANGKPGIHHVLTRSFKDLILRYKTMQGYHIPRKAGWDTHGLPVELEVEKKLGISGKKQIEDIVPGDPQASMIKFNKLCKESVWTYKKDWEEMTDRVAFWLDLAHPYITYENSYIETLWWIIKHIYDRGLLYEDYKIVPYCPRCGTSLSSHEVAQGYKDDTPDPSVYVKFRIQDAELRIQNTEYKKNLQAENLNQNVYFLVWTTTPWTLPGNVALAVGKNVSYAAIKINHGGRDEVWILAKERLGEIPIEEPYTILAELPGSALIGTSYTPLYATGKEKNKNDYTVYTANFVSTTDGTGIVHIAPAFGEDDSVLGKEKKLSTLLTVDPEGKVNVDVPGKGKFVKDADKDIAADLLGRGLLYKEEVIRHTYPFCWRCQTPLLYYAKISWWIKMSALRNELIKNNKQINWVPAHLKAGRFGEWLRGVKDWAFSRERYWGTPLPIWRCEKCKSSKALGAISDFPSSKNKYFMLRHGEANSNTMRIVTSRRDAPVHLTLNGKQQIEKAAQELKHKKIDLIYASDFIRTHETAEIVSRALGIPVTYDRRLYELNVGDYEGLSIPEYMAKFPAGNVSRFDVRAPDGENLRDVLRREVNLIHELEEKYQEKNILLVGHGDPLWVLEGAYRGRMPEDIIASGAAGDYISRGEIRELPVRSIPQDADGFLDLHRPYVDAITLACQKCGNVMRRVSDVIDVWFDSGAMPFAQAHFPFAFTQTQNVKLKNQNLGIAFGDNIKKLQKELAFPADYICEAIDQTRGWFYTLLAVSTLLGYKTPPYKNVVSLGHVLDAKGQKMSKSRGNVVVPHEVISRYGADSLRFYFYTASQPGDPKKFDIKGVDEVLKKTLLILWNVFEFWKLYASGNETKNMVIENILDVWLLSRLNILIDDVRKHLDAYEITEAGRKLADFVNDLSTWYVRRSRDRFKSAGQDKESALRVLTLALETTAQLFAPFTPFISEKIYKEVSGEESVHLAAWPVPTKEFINRGILQEMETARRIVRLVLEERARLSIPVRQPLTSLKIINASLKFETLEIIKDEINVKNIDQAQGTGELRITLDATITPELRLEGLKRELVRHINALRKEAKLTIRDRVDLYYETPSEDLTTVFKTFSADLGANTLSRSIQQGRASVDFEKELEIGGNKLWIGIKK